MSWKVLWIVVVGLGGFGLLGPAPAAAQSQDDAEARRQFRLGQAHYENGEFQRAAEAFEAAYRASGRARLLFNAYLAYRDMQDLPNSARTLRTFLDEASDVDPGERDQLNARLAAIERAMARQQTSMPADTATPTQGEQDLGQGEPTDPQPEPIEREEPPPTQSSGGGGLSPIGFIVGGVGLALGAVALGTGIASNGDLATLEGECPADRCPDTGELRDTQSRGEMLAALTDVFWVTGLVAVAAGVALIFLLEDGGDDDVQAGVGCTPEGCYGTLSTRF